MMRKFSRLVILLILFSQSSLLFGKNWVIAAQKFSFPKRQDNAVTRGLAVTIPEKILEQILQYSSREILEDEKNQRKLYDLKNQRTSLFLQLSAEVQKRDALVLSVSDKKALEKKLAEADKNLENLKNQIDENLKTQQEIINNTYVEPEQSTDFLTKAFTREEDSALIENIAIYKNDSSALYTFKIENEEINYSSSIVEKELVTAGINGFIKGNINVYSQYITVTIELYVYPGAKQLVTLKEYGTIDDIDTIAYNLVSQLNTSITNALPAVLKICDVPDGVQVFIDNKLVSDKAENYTIPAGVHTLEFTGKDYKPASVSQYFEGNKNYVVKVNLEELVPKKITLQTVKPLFGDFYANGQMAQDSVISINGKSVLGQFISENQVATFYYITEENLQNGTAYAISARDLDTGDYIEKRRRWMYTSYSVLVTSLMPLFFCKGQANSYIAANNAGILTSENDLQTANNWIIASNVATGVSVGCGVWFVYELVRYLYAANKVLPSEAKIINVE